jgi:hypothetical protein
MQASELQRRSAQKPNLRVAKSPDRNARRRKDARIASGNTKGMREVRNISSISAAALPYHLLELAPQGVIRQAIASDRDLCVKGHGRRTVLAACAEKDRNQKAKFATTGVLKERESSTQKPDFTLYRLNEPAT